jgi:uncharacterized protein involved in cysteine biosynthesis
LALRQIADPAILRLLLKSIGVTLSIFALLGLALFQVVVELAAQLGLGAQTEATYFVTIVLTLLAGWLLFRVVAIAVLQFFADEVVLAVERKHYPQAAARARKLPFREDLANSLRGAGRALLFNLLALPFALMLLFTAIGPAVVFLAVNAVLLGRELTDMPWLRHRASQAGASPIPAGERLMLGLAIAALMLVPFANLLAPVIGAAAGTHLFQLARRRGIS